MKRKFSVEAGNSNPIKMVSRSVVGKRPMALSAAGFKPFAMSPLKSSSLS